MFAIQRHKLIRALTTLCLICASSLSQGVETIELSNQLEEIDLAKSHIEMFEDRADRLTINEITTNRSTLFPIRM